MNLPDRLSRLDVCDLTTSGRVTGRPHTIEIWFAHHEGTLYILSGGGDRSDWVRNVISTPTVTVRLNGTEYRGRGRIVTEPQEDRLARRLVFDKYQPGYGEDLAGWRESSLPVAVHLSPAL